MAGAWHALLDRAWGGAPSILSFLGAVNHKQVGVRYIVTGFFFFGLAGLDAAIMRLQLAAPGLEVVTAGTFAQLFTTHGTAMMFLFAVPMVEAIGIYFVPLMIGARDMAFPRLNAFGYWLYLFAGLLLYSSTLPDIVNFVWPGDLLPDVVPDGGWFAYPPLTGPQHSPGPAIDFYLIAVTLAEISALIAAVELVVTVLKQRAPGMTPIRIPILVWSVLAMAFAILFAFPAVVVASVLLEVERTAGLPFYDVARGGDPILWQHLFWIFAHPEVYIMFIPATGVVSTVLATFTGRPIVGYRLVVGAILATTILSFGLWVHHMFAVGLPWLGLAYFSAASMIIAIPSGIQVFAWLATMVRAVELRMSTAMLFIVGFIVTFVFGGITGVMVASVPFDLQSHDTYFVVAHFHYVLVGGVVLPIFAGVWYWFPKVSGRLLSERLGKWFFWLFFVGLNVTFLPQHQLGLLGMRRRVWTYESDPWFDLFNLVSSAGMLAMIAGFVVGAVAVVRALRSGPAAGPDPWRAGTMEWGVASPPPSYSFATFPTVRGREPLWPADLEGGIDVPQPPAVTAADKAPVRRETLGSGVLGARPEATLVLPANSLLPLAAAVMLTLGFAAVIFRLYPVAVGGVALAVVLILAWIWRDPLDDDVGTEPMPTVSARLPVHVTGTRSTVWWGIVLGTALLATIFADLLFAHLYLAYSSAAWPPAGIAVPDAWLPGVALVPLALVLGSALVAGRGAAAADVGRVRLGLAGVVLAGLGHLGLAAAAWLAGGPSPTESAYGAAFWALGGGQLVLVAGGVVATLVPLLRVLRGRFDLRRRAALDGAVVWWGFVLLAGGVTWAVLHVAPRLMP